MDSENNDVIEYLQKRTETLSSQRKSQTQKAQKPVIKKEDSDLGFEIKVIGTPSPSTAESRRAVKEDKVSAEDPLKMLKQAISNDGLDTPPRTPVTEPKQEVKVVEVKPKVDEPRQPTEEEKLHKQLDDLDKIFDF